MSTASSGMSATRIQPAHHYTSDKACLQSTITNVRMTADNTVAIVVETTSQTEQVSLNFDNSVERIGVSGKILSQGDYPNNVESPERYKPRRNFPNGGHLIRKHSVEAVSRSLDLLMASGKAMIEDLVKSRELRSKREDVRCSGEREDNDSLMVLRKRGTYDLGKVADILDGNMATSSSVVETLNYVSQEIDVSQGTVSSSDIRRNTYDLSELADVLDESHVEDCDRSLEELLRDLGCDDNDNHNGDTSQKGNINKRQTYDLSDVSCDLDESAGSGQSIEETLEHISVMEDNHCDKRRTYDLSDISSELDQSMNSSVLDESNHSASMPLVKTVSEKRRTYNLDDVSNQLDHSLNCGEKLETSLELISSDHEESPSCQQTAEEYNMVGKYQYQYNNNVIGLNKTDNTNVDKLIRSDLPGNSESKHVGEIHEESLSGETVASAADGNIHTKSHKFCKSRTNSPRANGVGANDQNGETILHHDDVYSKATTSSPIAKSVKMLGDTQDIVETAGETLTNSQSMTEKRKTYILENHDLTPSQWVTKMEMAESSPIVSLGKENNLPEKDHNKKYSSTKMSVTQVKKPPRGNSPKSIKDPEVSDVANTKRSKSVSTTPKSQLTSRSSSDVRQRSMSDSNSASKLRSQSSPDISTPVSSSEKEPLAEILKEISPGVRNYLTNKLGLSGEQCLEVYRRLNNGTSTELEHLKMVNRRTYSLDDVAQSLDIATSQGLPITKVLDKLEFESDMKVDHDKEETKTIEKNQLSNIEESSVGEGLTEDKLSDHEQRGPNEASPSAYVTLHQTKFAVNRHTGTSISGDKVKHPDAKDDEKSLDNICQLKLNSRKAVYKPSSQLHSFSHLLEGRNVKRRGGRRVNEVKRNTYTLESVAESLEKAQDAGETMLGALKRLSGSLKSEESGVCDSEKRKTYSLEDVSNTLEAGTASGVGIVETLKKIAEPNMIPAVGVVENDKPVHKQKRKAPPKPKRTFGKPAIKFESDSFVIEYFTSPKRTLSESSEPESTDGDEDLDMSGGYKHNGSTGVLPTVVETCTCNPSEKVVLDLDSLLEKLAAERDKTKDSNLIESKENVICETGKEISIMMEGELPKSSENDLVTSELDTDNRSDVHDAAVLPVSGDVNTAADEKPLHDPPGTDTSVISQACTEPTSDNTPVTSEVELTENTTTTSEFTASQLKVDSQNTAIVCETFVELEANMGLIDCDTILLDTVHDKSNEEKHVAVPRPDLLSGTSSVSLKDMGDPKCTGAGFQQGTENGSNEELRNIPKPDLLQQVDCDHTSKEETITETEDIDNEHDCKGEKQLLSVTTDTDHGDEPDNCQQQNMEMVDTNKVNYTNSEQQSKAHSMKDVGVELDDKPPDVEYMYIHLPGGNDKTLQRGQTSLAAPDKAELPTSEDSAEGTTVGEPSNKGDGVSRELNLLRLKLAEKQRDIEAQKQRTQEQLEEERKRLGQNVFWFAVGKGREKKESNEIKEHRKNVQLPLSSTGDKSVDSSQTLTTSSSKTFIKASPDQELPPSMEKLQGVSYNLKTINGNLRGSHGELAPRDDLSASASVASKSSATFPRSAENVGQEYVGLSSRSMHGSHDPSLDKPAQVSPHENSRGEKPRAPVMNYKSRISVPLTYSKQTPEVEPTSAGMRNGDENASYNNNKPSSDNSESSLMKPSSLDFSDMDIPGDIVVSPDERGQTRADANQPSSPVRKRWETDPTSIGEPQLAVSKSNHNILNANNTSREMVLVGSPETNADNLNDSDTKDGEEVPKKGFSLFIGDNTDAGENGLTPEQLKKKEKFLRNRQQKMEEEKVKKEAILEKKRRKEEKMSAIQLRREQEELNRHARLQEKKEQAEMAKMERQRYEQHRKDNLPGTTFTTGSPSSRYQARTNHYADVPSHNHHVSPTPSSPSAFSGFSGVQSYVKPSGKTNRKLIINAISHVCLPGEVNKDTKDKCLQAMTESSAQHFLILFREGLKFRGLYSLDLDNNQVLKVHGVGPRSVSEKMIQQLYKYNSGAKEFSKLPAKSFSLSVDGFTLQKSCWQSTNKPSVASKTVSNYKQQFRSAR